MSVQSNEQGIWLNRRSLESSQHCWEALLLAPSYFMVICGCVNILFQLLKTVDLIPYRAAPQESIVTLELL